MNVLFFSFALIVVGILLYHKFFNSHATVVSSNGYVCDPIFFSGNKSQKKKKHNMLRISKFTKK